MKTINKIALLALLVIVSSACNRYLDIKPYGKTIPKTAEEFSALLHDVLDKIDIGEETLIGDVSSSAEYECYADNLEANITEYPKGNYISLYVGSRLSSKQSRYRVLYEYIRTANIVIDNLDEGKDTRLGKDVLGTAFAIRGVAYYELLREFCQSYSSDKEQSGIPLVTSFDMEGKPLRSSMEETIAQVESDLKEAMKYEISDEIYRFNNDVLKGYLARLYFWTENYSLAKQYALEVLNKYPLLEGDAYLDMMKSQTAMKGNMIFKSNVKNTSSSTISISGTKDYLASRPISVRFINLFTEGANDIRYNLCIGKKRVFAKNIFACMRSAEMCLIAAESSYHMNDNGEALKYLNDLRRHRISNYTDLTMATLPSVDATDFVVKDAKGNSVTPLLSMIFQERRKELFLEGDRWFEMKRNGCPEFWSAKQGLKYYTREFMYTFPIPVEDITVLPGLEQNPGYEKVE